jgi:hypothetical protein
LLEDRESRSREIRVYILSRPEAEAMIEGLGEAREKVYPLPDPRFELKLKIDEWKRELNIVCDDSLLTWSSVSSHLPGA